MERKPSPALLTIWRLILWIVFAVCVLPLMGILLIATLASERIEPIVIGVFLTVVFAGIAGFIHIYTGLFHKSIVYALDEKRISLRYGVWWRVQKAIPIEKVTDVRTIQGPLERMYGIGQVQIYTPSTGAMCPEGLMRGLTDYEGVRDTIAANILALRGVSHAKEV
ncbi:MAG: PH domain-containing protein [Planctomycetota bacterium]|nr:PH domain-containing protein [Planctomycetota bacterium]